MNVSGDAAEQIVRMSLEGTETAVKLTGHGAKHTALLMAAILRGNQKTKGKARLSSMLKSGKELKVFTVQQKDLKDFSREAKRYGVLYCVLKNPNDKSPTAEVDVIARADDASKIQRITERFKLATVANVVTEKEMSKVNPTLAKAEKDAPLSEPDSKKQDRLNGAPGKNRPSVRKKLEGYRKEIQEKKIGKKEKEILDPFLAGKTKPIKDKIAR